MEKLLLLSIVFIFADVYGKDAIHAEFAIGSDVVIAAIRKLQDTCIFPNDNLFLRRLAFVQSKDGHDLQNIWDSDKGRGGIWQIPVDTFSQIKNTFDSDHLQPELNLTIGNLNWQNGDLRIPMNSLVAARLLINSSIYPTRNSMIKSIADVDFPIFPPAGLWMDPSSVDSSHIPMNISAQAVLWVHKFNPSRKPQEFIDAVSKMPKCQTPAMDIIFIVDSSSSMENFGQGGGNYHHIRSFLMNVISGLKSQRSIRVGISLFGDNATMIFPLSDDLDKAHKAGEELPFLNGDTNIEAGFNAAREEFIQNGRPGVPQVAILITDGEPTKNEWYPPTDVAAEKVKNAGIIVFSVAVGNFNYAKMVEWASSPTCMHFYKLEDFNQLENSFPELLNFQLCEVSFNLSLSKNCTSGIVSKTQYLFYEIEMDPRNDTAITLQLSNGGATLYTSKNSRLPSSAEYDFMANSTLKSSAEIFYTISENVSQIFASVVGMEDDSSFTLCRQIGGKKTTTTTTTTTTTQAPIPITQKSKWFDIKTNLHWLNYDAPPPHAHHYYYHH